MKLLTKKTDYAIRALVSMTKNGDKYVSSRALSQQQKVPYEYMRKVLQGLVRAGLAESAEGGAGGYKIARDPLGIKVSEVISVFQGAIELSECLFRRKICQNRKDCVLRKNIKRIEKIIEREFDNISIGSLYAETQAGEDG